MSAWWRRLFGPSPKEIIDRAILRAANAQADVEQACVRLSYYQRLVAASNPYTDWWRFAELAQAEDDAKEDARFFRERQIKATAECDLLVAENTKC